MRKYKLVTPEVKPYKSLEEVKCDVCGDISTKEWQKGNYDALEISCFKKTGTSYPEGGCGEIKSIDFCPKCFEEKLIPWVESFGGQITIDDWDW